MINKIDVMGWGAVIGVIGFGAYAIYTGVQQLPWLARNAKGDEYRAEKAITAQGMSDEATKASIESGRSVDYYMQTMEDTGYLTQHPDYARALNDYERELDEYHDLLAEYDPNRWIWPWDSEAKQDYMTLLKEYKEAVAAFDNVVAIYGANNS